MSQTAATENKKVSKETFELIKGEFTVQEAAEMVNDLFSKRINLLEVQSFSQEIRLGEKDPETLKQISELLNKKEEAWNMICEAKNSGKSLKVNSTISIELV